MRIDKYLWCVRLFKTRSLATKACSTGQIRLNGADVKPGHTVKEGNVIEVKTGAFWRSYKVLDFPKNRLGAKLVADFLIETTPEDFKVQIEDISRINRENKLLGIIGRPTKKQRRNLDKWKGV